MQNFHRRVSIVRGRVVTMSGQGLIGVRVSVDRTLDASNYGFTLSRPDGWYDICPRLCLLLSTLKTLEIQILLVRKKDNPLSPMGMLLV